MSKAGVGARSALILALGALGNGCGSGSENGAPVGATITFKPVSYSVHNDSATAGCYLDSPVPIDITIANATGVPLNDIVFTLQGDDPLYIFDDNNNNLLLDDTELTPVPITYISTTSSFGTKRVFLSATLGGTGCTGHPTEGLKYTTDIGAYSGTLYNKMTITVTSATATTP